MSESRAGRVPFRLQIQDLLDHKEEKERERWRETGRVGEACTERKWGRMRTEEVNGRKEGILGEKKESWDPS